MMRIKQLNPAEDANDLAAAFPAFRVGSIETKSGFPPPGRARLRTWAIGRDGQFSQTLAAIAPDGTVLGIGLYDGELERNPRNAGPSTSSRSPYESPREGASKRPKEQPRRGTAAVAAPVSEWSWHGVAAPS